MKYLTAAAALVGATYAHGHHDDQTPIEGPHQGLWYNTLPGDGGTQVCLRLFCHPEHSLTAIGGLRLLWHQYFWSPAVRTLPCYQ